MSDEKNDNIYNQNNKKNEDESFSLFSESNNKKNENPYKPKTNVNNVYQKKHNKGLINLDNNNENSYKNSKNIFNKNNNNKDEPINLIKIEEQRKRKEAEEKENKIRDKLKCFICFGKVINATMCTKCNGIACEECIQKMLLKNPICSNCKKSVKFQDMIKLPFMNDLTAFFINNVENKDNEVNINNNNNIQNIMIQLCKYHPDKKVEYICLTCNEYFCSECLILTNKKNVAKHNDHIILSNDQINEFNFNKLIKELQLLYDKKKDLDKIINNYNLAIKEIQIRKKRSDALMDSMKNNLQSKYSKAIFEIDELIKLLKTKKIEINNGIKSFPKHCNEEIIKENNIEKNKLILNTLQKLNYPPINKDEIEKKTNFQKNILCESYESDIINFKMPNNGIYLEEANVLNQELNFIPNTQCKLQSQLLFNCIVFTLIIQINNDYYEKHHPKYFGDLIILSKNKCEYAIFTDYYNKGEQILTVEFEFSKMKSLLDENYKCNMKFLISRYIFK